MWVSMASRMHPPLRSDLEGVESGWGDGDPQKEKRGPHDRSPGREAARLRRFVGTRPTGGEQGWNQGLRAGLSAPHLDGLMPEDGPGSGALHSALHALGLDLRSSCRAHLTVSCSPPAEDGPWTLCSASCGGGSQSRSVYCVSSDGASAQEAAEDAECEGLPEKPPGTHGNLVRQAMWSPERGEPSPSGMGWSSGAGCGHATGT